MATPIISGFSLGSATPIDTRIVASGSSARDAIQYKYDGLRVFDTNDRIPYVWRVDTATWSSENSNGVTSTFSSVNRVPLFTSIGIIGNSNIVIVANSICMINYPLVLVTGGTVSASYFQGNGYSLTNLNVNNTNISGRVSLDNLPTGGTAGWVLVGNSPNSPKFISPTNSLSVNYSTNAGTSTQVVNSTVATGSNYPVALLSGNNIKYNNTLYYNANDSVLSGRSFKCSPIPLGYRSSYNLSSAVSVEQYYPLSEQSVIRTNTVGSVNISSDSIFKIEATFVSVVDMSLGLHYQSNTISALYSSDTDGILTLISPISTNFSTIDTIISYGTFSILNANELNFEQNTYLSEDNYYYKSHVSYRIDLLNYA